MQYQIKEIDYWELDAILEVDGQDYYFQFPFGVTPDLGYALQYLFLEGRLVFKR